MNLFKRVGRLFGATANEGVTKLEGIKGIQILENENRKLAKAIGKIDDSIAELLGNKNITTKDILKNEKEIELLEKTADKAMASGNKLLWMSTKQRLTPLLSRRESLDKINKQYEETHVLLEKKLKGLKQKQNEHTLKISELKIANDFSKNLKTINKSLKTLSSDEFKNSGLGDIEKKIELGLEIELQKNNRIMDEGQIENGITEEDILSEEWDKLVSEKNNTKTESEVK